MKHCSAQWNLLRSKIILKGYKSQIPICEFSNLDSNRFRFIVILKGYKSQIPICEFSNLDPNRFRFTVILKGYKSQIPVYEHYENVQRVLYKCDNSSIC
ncbi:Hypothetical predicted protein [Octopus vulgaris]|uniref:Uncharacterized protein n=1 Tax=Octopus vulgaris TaxID=6645 RepID=A0AA36B4P0_OCTVU|nr:Hypothetical predicted protein [Octopus vulgaris]